MPRVTITVPDKNAQPYRFQLDRQVVTMGRGSDNDIVIDSGSVSGKHAEMHRIDGGYELRDVGSTNGIKLGGERYEKIPLRHGATVKIGDVSFDFVLTDEERDALAREKVLEESPISRERELPPLVTALPPAPPRAPQRPVPQRPVPQRHVPVVVTRESGAGWMVALFLVLAAIAFFVGLSIRHQKETGTSLVDDIRARFAKPVATAPAAPAADADPAAEVMPTAETPPPTEEPPVPAPEPAAPEAPAPEPVVEEDAPAEEEEEAPEED